MKRILLVLLFGIAVSVRAQKAPVRVVYDQAWISATMEHNTSHEKQKAEDFLYNFSGNFQSDSTCSNLELAIVRDWNKDSETLLEIDKYPHWFLMVYFHTDQTAQDWTLSYQDHSRKNTSVSRFSKGKDDVRTMVHSVCRIANGQGGTVRENALRENPTPRDSCNEQAQKIFAEETSNLSRAYWVRPLSQNIKGYRTVRGCYAVHSLEGIGTEDKSSFHTVTVKDVSGRLAGGFLQFEGQRKPLCQVAPINDQNIIQCHSYGEFNDLIEKYFGIRRHEVSNEGRSGLTSH
jgi:hypothetical protein